MKIKIYQIDISRDDDAVCFLGLDRLEKFQGTNRINSSIYDCVYEGEVDCKTIEDVYTTFNFHHPEDYHARSLSVSDIVQVEAGGVVTPGFYYCDMIGFKEVEFHPEDANTRSAISVLLVEPGQSPRMIQIEDTLEAMQQIVGGYIEEYMPFDDPVAIICNDEGKIDGLPLNRAIRAEDDRNEIIDVIAGTFFICYAKEDAERFQSLPEEFVKKYSDLFKNPERFFRTANGIVAVPYNSERILTGRQDSR